ncbi:lipase 2 [Candida albicans P57072]|nr:lipase 2 [Candida albicans P57072]KHC40949.1 lipase 2 [Candida albicans P76055]KHC41615.1 lipase 2 [Candida albicans P76067]
MKGLVFLLSLLPTIYASLVHITPASEDDFYNPPAGFESAKNGDILKLRNSPNRLASFYFPIDVKNAWQLLVKSEDSFGNPNAFVTTLIEPYNADPSKVVSYQTWEDASNINCSPSYGAQFGSPLSTITTQIDMTLIVPPLRSGYYVVTPDYEGPKATFAVGRQSGQATLDSVRAILKSGSFSGINEDAKVALWGYSGGSLATGWAAALQPVYAPELQKNIVGAAVGGFAANITAIAESVDGTIFAGLITLALNGLANEYPDLKTAFYEELSDFAVPEFKAGAENCLAENIFHYPLHQYFTGPKRAFEKGWGLLKEDIFNKSIQDNLLIGLNKTYLPQVPVLIYHGTVDEIIPIKDPHAQYQLWCDWGIESLEFAEDLSTGHLAETFTGAPAALAWIDARFDGKTPIQGCSHTTRLTNLLYPNTSDSTHSYFLGIYQAVFGTPLGPGINGDNITINSGLLGLVSSII